MEHTNGFNAGIVSYSGSVLVHSMSSYAEASVFHVGTNDGTSCLYPTTVVVLVDGPKFAQTLVHVMNNRFFPNHHHDRVRPDSQPTAANAAIQGQRARLWQVHPRPTRSALTDSSSLVFAVDMLFYRYVRLSHPHLACTHLIARLENTFNA
jgi:hypothetical protein